MNYAVIAAGSGSRLANGTGVSKPLVELDGRPMLRRLIDIFTRCGAESLAVIITPSMTEVRRYLEELAPSLPYRLDIVSKLTAGPVFSLCGLLPLIPPGKFVLTTVDTIFDEDEFREYVGAFTDTPDILMGVTGYVDDEKPLYVDVDGNTDRITSFSDTPAGGPAYVSGGIYGLDTQSARLALDRCLDHGQTRMRDFQRMLLADGCIVRAWKFGTIIDVDRPSDIVAARRFIADSSSTIS